MYQCKYARFRVSGKPSPGVPLAVRSVGHHTVPARWSDQVFTVEHVVFIWGIEGTGVTVFGGRAQDLPPQSIGIYMPGMVQEMHTREKSWEYCWWTMDGEQAQPLVRGFGFEAGVRPAGPAPTALIRQLETMIQRPGPSGEIDAAVVGYDLLSAAAKATHLCEGNRQDERLVGSAVDLILQSWQDPTFGVDQLAAALDTHRSTLSRRFHRVTGTTVIGYITAVRMRNATHMLRHSSASITEIAHQCGYNDPNYFSRALKDRLGVSPSEFRKVS